MSKKNENYTSRKKRRRLSGKSIVTMVICCVLALLAVVGAVAVFKPKPLNPDNLLKYENYSNMLTESTEGLKVKWDDDGSFTLSGKHKSDNTLNNSKYTNPFASVTLMPGKYLISSGNDKCDSESYGLYYRYNGNYVEVYGDVVELPIGELTVVEIGFFVKNNKNIIYADFEPVLVPDGASTSFHAEK